MYRSRRELSLATFGFDTAENEPCKVCPLSAYRPSPDHYYYYYRSLRFVSPAKDPVTFIVNCLLIGITAYTVANMSWGESYFVKRKRLIKERIRQQYGLQEGWDDGIDDEGFDEELLKATPGEEAKALEARQ